MQSNWSLPQSSTRVAPEAYNQHFSILYAWCFGN